MPPSAYALVVGIANYECINKHLQEPLLDPYKFYPALPDAIVRVINKALAKEPGQCLPGCARDTG
jgi:hypothetical protein